MTTKTQTPPGAVRKGILPDRLPRAFKKPADAMNPVPPGWAAQADALKRIVQQQQREILALRTAVRELRERQQVQAKEVAALRTRIANPPVQHHEASMNVAPPSSSAQEKADSAAEHEWQARLQQGEAVRLRWVSEGLLIPSQQLAAAWGRSPQALSQADRRGRLVSLKVKGDRYYPSVFATLEAEAVNDVCSRLVGEDAVGKFIFWNRPHGSLGGLTPAEAINAGKGAEVARLADAWSAERGLAA